MPGATGLLSCQGPTAAVSCASSLPSPHQLANFPTGRGRSEADNVYPLDGSLALGGGNPDARQGLCGRCFEVRCRTGYPRTDYARQSDATLIPTDASFDMALLAPGWRDSRGRAFPDPDKARLPHVWARCWDEGSSVVARSVDVCACENSWGRNEPCCQKAPHLDLTCASERASGAGAGVSPIPAPPASHDFKPAVNSYWTFERLAHPLFGNAIVQYRPVDCGSHAPNPAPSQGVPGGATGLVYARGGGPGPGWGVNLYRSLEASWVTPDGACATLASGGGELAFVCLRCAAVFSGGPIQLAVRVDGKGGACGADGGAGALQLLVSRVPGDGVDGGGGADGEGACSAKPLLGAADLPGHCDGDGFASFSVPWSKLGCAFPPAAANRVALVNARAGDSVRFCLRELRV